MRNFLNGFTLLSVFSALFSGSFNALSQDVLEERSPYNIHRTHSKIQISVGSWGEIEFYPIILEPSDFYLLTSEDFKQSSTKTVWRFDANDGTAVQKILINSGLSPELASRLVRPQFLSKNATINLMEITPPEEVILGLTQAQRAQLYPQLMPKNTISPFFQPFTLPNGGIDAVSHRPTGLPPDQIDRIRKLSFTLGSTTRLSDINLLMGKAMNDDERLRILKTLSRNSSLSTRLKLHPGTNLQKLTSYWECGGKNKDIGPILESVIRTSGIDHIDLVHLLPPTPRKLLHTYPSPSGEGLGDDLPDCFWTSFAFFADTPPDRHLDFVGHIFNERYELAEKPLQFGDLVLFTKDGPTDWIHACNYIAGNLVFTKNGMSMGRPWTILPLNDVAQSYLSGQEITISFFRLKPGYQR